MPAWFCTAEMVLRSRKERCHSWPSDGIHGFDCAAGQVECCWTKGRQLGRDTAEQFEERGVVDRRDRRFAVFVVGEAVAECEESRYGPVYVATAVLGREAWYSYGRQGVTSWELTLR